MTAAKPAAQFQGQIYNGEIWDASYLPGSPLYNTEHICIYRPQAVTRLSAGLLHSIVPSPLGHSSRCISSTLPNGARCCVAPCPGWVRMGSGDRLLEGFLIDLELPKIFVQAQHSSLAPNYSMVVLGCHLAHWPGPWQGCTPSVGHTMLNAGTLGTLRNLVTPQSSFI